MCKGHPVAEWPNLYVLVYDIRNICRVKLKVHIERIIVTKTTPPACVLPPSGSGAKSKTCSLERFVEGWRELFQ